MLMLGLLPLLLFTFSGVMIMAAQQTLATASAEGARASLRYGSANERRTAACVAARSSMQWLLNSLDRVSTAAMAAATQSLSPRRHPAPAWPLRSA
ncbi:hypothetical protein VM57_11835 [Stenotrophomonas maltophilia]|uniref:Pilus assembly protein TadE n=1 Tax=Stenotrophomonas maltophilia TaxID=40324 RepID=A0A0F5ZQD2_STEMA|nr:hypothetical protein VM57_11835 [Stenotrophomonas maltophilia]